MSISIQVCDGWDVPVVLGTGERVTLHFRSEPTEAEITAAAAAYVKATKPDEPAQASVEPASEPAYVIECEDGTLA